jgi:hypothetical protein
MNAWRCTDCGKLANAKAKPRAHIRNGQPCGPFTEALVAGEGAALVDVRPIPRPTTYRQSLLRSFETCGRRTLADLKIPDEISTGNSGALADLGSAAHAVFAAILRDLHRDGQDQPSTTRALELMRRTLAEGEWVLPTDERHVLRELVMSFATYDRWDTKRIMALERPLSLELLCDDGEIRTLTGQPDLIIADPPDGLIVVDFKTGLGVPKSPRQMPAEGEPIVGREYLSPSGTFQLDLYGLLALRRYPAAQRVTLRELHLRFGHRREATLGRDELPEVERQIALQMMLLDRAIIEGDRSELWRPRPGRHCLRQCPVARSCPIPDEQRGLGALSSKEDADEEAARFVVVDALRQTQREALKAYHEETGEAPEVGDGRGLFWKRKEKGGRSFDVHDLADFRPVPEAVAA